MRILICYRMQATDAWCLYDSFVSERVKKEIRKRNKKIGKQSSVPPFIFIATKYKMMFPVEIVLFEALNFAIRITVTIQIYWFRVIDLFLYFSKIFPNFCRIFSDLFRSLIFFLNSKITLIVQLNFYKILVNTFKFFKNFLGI